MRQFLVVTVLGAVLAFGASAAFAGDDINHRVPSEQAQSVSNVSVIESGHSMVAGGVSTAPVYNQLREDNWGR